MSRARSILALARARSPFSRSSARPGRRRRRRPTRAAAQHATVRIALDYSANVNYLGIYVAIEKGYFARQGIALKIIPYANTPAETLVQSGTTDLGISYPPDVIINRARGLRVQGGRGARRAEHDRRSPCSHRRSTRARRS